MSNKIIICGKGASGKDYLTSVFRNKNFNIGIKHTTRPKRETEHDGVEYHFISKEKFLKMIKENKFIEYEVHNDWYYGTTFSQWLYSSVFIFTPGSINQIKQNYNLDNTLIIYLNLDKHVREKRLLERNDIDDHKRRLNQDDIDFKNFDLFDIEIKNSDF